MTKTKWYLLAHRFPAFYVGIKRCRPVLELNIGYILFFKTYKLRYTGIATLIKNFMGIVMR